MRNKFGSFDLTVTIGEVLYQTIMNLTQCEEWILVEAGLLPSHYGLKTTVHPKYIYTVQFIISRAIACFDDERAKDIVCLIVNEVELVIACAIYKLREKYPYDQKYYPTQIIITLGEFIDVFIEKLKTGWIVTNEVLENLDGGSLKLNVNIDELRLKSGNNIQVLRQTKILYFDPRSLLSLHDLLTVVSKKYNYEVLEICVEKDDSLSNNTCYIFGHPENISEFQTILTQEIAPRKILDQPKTLYASCLNWFSGTQPPNCIENIDGSFKLIKNHAEFLPYQGYIVLYQAHKEKYAITERQKKKEFLKKIHHEYDDIYQNGFSLYKSHPHIKVGLVFEEPVVALTIVVRYEYEMIRLIGNDNNCYLSSRCPLNFPGLEYYEFRIRKPTIDELEAIKLMCNDGSARIVGNSGDDKKFMDRLNSQIEEEKIETMRMQY